MEFDQGLDQVAIEAQDRILAFVNENVNSTEWGLESKQRLGMIYLALHFGTIVLRGGANSIAGPVMSESAGGLSRTYATASLVTGGDTALESTAWGREYARLVRTLPARVGFVL